MSSSLIAYADAAGDAEDDGDGRFLLLENERVSTKKSR